MSEESQPPAWKRTLLICLYIVAGLALLLGGYFLYRPLRANGLAREALAAFEQGKGELAREKIRVAQELSFKSLEVLRAAATIWGAAVPGQVVPLWEMAVERSGGALRDRQALTLALLASGELERARVEVEGLLKEAPQEPHTVFVQANYLLQTGARQEAWEKLGRLLESVSDNELYWRTYGGLSSLLGEKALGEYRRRLETLTSRKDRLGHFALEELALYAPKDELDGRINALLRHPLSTRATILYAFNLRRVKAQLPYLEIRKGVSGLFNQALESERQELARFYRSIGDSAGVLEVVNPTMALRSRENLMLYLDGLSGLGRYEAVLEILSVEKLPLEEYWRELFRQRTYLSLKKPLDAALAWKKALAAATGDVSALSQMADYQTTAGDVSSLEELMPRLVEAANPLSRLSYYRLWLRQRLGRRDTVGAQSLLAEMSKLYPDNDAIKNDYIYYSLLLNKDGDWLNEAYALAKKSPSVLPFRMTLALALLKNGNAGKALEVIEGTRVSTWEVLPVGHQIIRAAVLKASGRKAVAVENLTAAFPEEQKLLAGPKSK